MGKVKKTEDVIEEDQIEIIEIHCLEYHHLPQ